MLNIGEQLPLFDAFDISGKAVDLQTPQRKYILFFKCANCPICAQRFFEVKRKQHLFKANNIQIICIFESGKEILNQALYKIDCDFNIIADPEGKIYDLYKINEVTYSSTTSLPVYDEIKTANKLNKTNTSKIRAEFVVKEDLTIEHLQYYRSSTDKPVINFKEILDYHFFN